MDPNLFYLDWEQTFEVLAAVVVAAFLVERALSIVFENRALLPLFAGSGVKELVTFLVSFAFCLYTKFDAVGTIFSREEASVPGWLITGGVIAGGSKAAVKLFRDVLGFRSSAYQEYRALVDKGERPDDAARRVARWKNSPPSPPNSPQFPSANRPE